MSGFNVHFNVTVISATLLAHVMNPVICVIIFVILAIEDNMAEKVLIVEDDEWMAEEFRSTLSESGFEVTDVVDSYEKALLSLRSNTPDLVILDIRLNGPGTGVDIAREINDRWKMPFLFLSSNIDPKTMKEVLDESPHSILAKPCKPVDLIAGVQLALSKDIEVSSNDEGFQQNSFFVKSEHAYQRIEIADLYFIKGEGSYTKLQLKNERLVLRAALKDFDFLNQHPKIVKIHRSYFVNIDHIDKIHNKFVEVKDFEVPVSGEGRDEVMKRINTVR